MHGEYILTTMQDQTQRGANATAAAAQQLLAGVQAAGPQGIPGHNAGQALIAGLPAVAAPAAPSGARMGIPIFQAPTRHSSFASLFADAASDPHHADAFQVVNSFNPSAAAPLTAVALKQAILG